MASRDIYRFWEKSRATRVTVTAGDEAEDYFTAEVDRAFAEASPSPPRSLLTTLGQAMSQWRAERRSRG
jgi:hypothetical protein